MAGNFVTDFTINFLSIVMLIFIQKSITRSVVNVTKNYRSQNYYFLVVILIGGQTLWLLCEINIPCGKGRVVYKKNSSFYAQNPRHHQMVHGINGRVFKKSSPEGLFLLHARNKSVWTFWH